MQKNCKLRWMALLMAMLMFTSVMTSCAASSNTPDAQTNADISTSSDIETDETEPVEQLPDVDYEGYTFNILNGNPDTYVWLWNRLDIEELTGDAVNDAIFMRNRKIEENLGIVIKETYDNAVQATFKKTVVAGTDDYDMAMVESMQAIPLSLENLLLDVSLMPYVNLDMPWYDQKIRSDLSIGNKLWYLASDMSLTHYDEVVTLFFNKTLVRDLNLYDPYELVHKNNWTYDTFYEMAQTASMDLNGDGKYDKNDRFGYMSWSFLLYPYIIFGSGEKIISKDSDDFPMFVMNNDRFVAVYQKALEMLFTPNMVYDANLAGRNHRDQNQMFPANQALFWTEIIHWAVDLRNMESDFGILPPPKYNTEQENFSNLCNNPHLVCVPASASDPERTGIIIEALSAESHRTLIPAYYDITLKTKVSRDTDSEAMLDIIFSSRRCELARTYFDSEIYSPMVNLAVKNDPGLVSMIEKQTLKVEAKIQKIIDQFNNTD